MVLRRIVRFAGVALAVLPLFGLMARLSGCGGGTAPLPPGATTTTATLTGQVVDGNAQPVRGVTVTIGGTPFTTGSDGRYSFTLPYNTEYVVTLSSGSATRIVGPLDLRVNLKPAGTVVPAVAVYVLGADNTFTVDATMATNGGTFTLQSESAEMPDLYIDVPAGAFPAGTQVTVANMTDTDSGLPGTLQTAGMATDNRIFPLGSIYIDTGGVAPTVPLTMRVVVGQSQAGQQVGVYAYNPATGVYDSLAVTTKSRQAVFQFSVPADGIVKYAVETIVDYLLYVVGFPGRLEASPGAEVLQQSNKSELPVASTDTTTTGTWQFNLAFVQTDLQNVAKAGVRTLIRALSRQQAAPTGPKPAHMPAATAFGVPLPFLGVYRTPSGSSSFIYRDEYETPIQVLQVNGTLQIDVVTDYTYVHIEHVAHSQGGG